MRSFEGNGEERAATSADTGEAGGAGGGKFMKGLAVAVDGAVIGRGWSEELYLDFFVDEENILARPFRSFPNLPKLFLLSDLLGRP